VLYIACIFIQRNCSAQAFLRFSRDKPFNAFTSIHAMPALGLLILELETVHLMYEEGLISTFHELFALWECASLFSDGDAYNQFEWRLVSPSGLWWTCTLMLLEGAWPTDVFLLELNPPVFAEGIAPAA